MLTSGPGHGERMDARGGRGRLGRFGAGEVGGSYSDDWEVGAVVVLVRVFMNAVSCRVELVHEVSRWKKKQESGRLCATRGRFVLFQQSPSNTDERPSQQSPPQYSLHTLCKINAKSQNKMTLTINTDLARIGEGCDTRAGAGEGVRLLHALKKGSTLR